MNTILLVFELLFGCWHRNLSWPFTLSGLAYEVCLTCGKQLAYDRADIGRVVAQRSSHNGRVLVAPRWTSLINSCPRCAISLAPLGEIRRQFRGSLTDAESTPDEARSDQHARSSRQIACPRTGCGRAAHSRRDLPGRFMRRSRKISLRRMRSSSSVTPLEKATPPTS